MTLEEFIKLFAAEFDNTAEDVFTAKTNYKSLDEWSSLVALSIISMVDEEFDKRLTGADLRSMDTIEDLYNLILTKKICHS